MLWLGMFSPVVFVGKQTGEDPKNIYSIICTQQSGAVEPQQQENIFVL